MSNLLTQRRILRSLTPDMVDSSSLWFDASHADTITVDGSAEASSLKNKLSVAASLIQATPSSRPAYTTDDRGFPCLFLDQSGGLVSLYSPIDEKAMFGPQGTEITVLIAGSYVSGSFIFCTNASNNAYHLRLTNTGTALANNVNGSPTYADTGSNAMPTGLFVLAVRWRSGHKIELQRHNSRGVEYLSSSSAMTASYTSASGYISLTRTVGSSEATYRFFELQVIPRAVDDSQLSGLVRRMKSKWGVYSS